MASAAKHMRVNQVDLLVSITGSGTPLVWGHGLMSSMAAEDLATWFHWQQLKERATLIRYDARGHGQSGASAQAEDYIWPSLAHDMLDIADQLHLEHFVAGGMSMGSATTLYAALAAPERISGLILATPPTAWETRAAQSAVYEQMASVVETEGTAMIAAQSQRILPPLLQEAAPEIVNRTSEWLKDYNPTTLATVLRGAQQTNFPPREQLQSLVMPTLILAWEGDPGHPLATAEQLQTLMPNAKLHIARTISDLEQWSMLMSNFLLSMEGATDEAQR